MEINPEAVLYRPIFLRAYPLLYIQPSVLFLTIWHSESMRWVPPYPTSMNMLFGVGYAAIAQ